MHLSIVFISYALVLAGTSTAVPIERGNMLMTRFADSDLLSEIEARAYDVKTGLYRRYGETVSANNDVSHKLTRRRSERNTWGDLGPPYRPSAPRQNRQNERNGQGQEHWQRQQPQLQQPQPQPQQPQQQPQQQLQHQRLQITNNLIGLFETHRRTPAVAEHATADGHQFPNHPPPGPSAPDPGPSSHGGASSRG